MYYDCFRSSDLQKGQFIFFRILRGSGGLPPEAEEFFNFHVGRRLILCLFYMYYDCFRSSDLQKGQFIFFRILRGSGGLPPEAEEFWNFHVGMSDF